MCQGRMIGLCVCYFDHLRKGREKNAFTRMMDQGHTQNRPEVIHHTFHNADCASNHIKRPYQRFEGLEVFPYA